MPFAASFRRILGLLALTLLMGALASACFSDDADAHADRRDGHLPAPQHRRRHLGRRRARVVRRLQRGPRHRATPITELAYPTGALPVGQLPLRLLEHLGEPRRAPRPTMEQATLEMLTPQYDVIVFKHCFPVSGIEAGHRDARRHLAGARRIENYKLQYAALKTKLRSFPDEPLHRLDRAPRCSQREHHARAGRARQGVLRLGAERLGRAGRQHLRLGLLRPRDRRRHLHAARARAARLAPERRRSPPRWRRSSPSAWWT